MARSGRTARWPLRPRHSARPRPARCVSRGALSGLRRDRGRQITCGYRSQGAQSGADAARQHQRLVREGDRFVWQWGDVRLGAGDGRDRVCRGRLAPLGRSAADQPLPGDALRLVVRGPFARRPPAMVQHVRLRQSRKGAAPLHEARSCLAHGTAVTNRPPPGPSGSSRPNGRRVPDAASVGRHPATALPRDWRRAPPCQRGVRSPIFFTAA